MNLFPANTGPSVPVNPSQVLVVDDEAGMRTALEISFLRNGWQVDTANGMTEAMAKFRQKNHPLIVTDIRMPDGDGFGVMQQARCLSPQTAVILLTGFGNVPEAVTAMQDGACDYLTKPVAFEKLELTAQRILKRVGSDQHGVASASCEELVGHSPALRRSLERAQQAAASDADILIQAESGTGKELLARMIHRLSSRHSHPFVAVNCAAFPETLLESELFGHSKGAFTGALNARAGKFEAAHGGTLLLDEIGEMPLGLQPKLLRVLQEREFDRLGETRTTKVNIRVIATTNRSLEEMVRQGSFRADLFYRLNVIPLSLPSLRERLEDVIELAEHFGRLYAPGGLAPALSAEFCAHLTNRRWMGNVRELANLMRRAVALSRGVVGIEVLEPSELHPAILNSERRPSGASSGQSLFGQSSSGQSYAGQPSSIGFSDNQHLRPGVSLRAVEQHLFQLTLDATGGNRSRAAEMLGVSLRTVRNKIREYGLPPRSNYVHD